MHREPHHRPPVHPVLYVKPANTWSAPGRAIELPADMPEIEVSPTLGIVFGRAASRVRAQDVAAYIAGYAVVHDVTAPHTSVLRPPIKQKCRDGFCPIGPVVPAGQVGDPSALAIRAYVNGELQLENSLANLIRGIPKLVADVTDFMSFGQGDILLVGVPEGAPRARVGDRVAVEVERVGRIENPLVAEGAQA